MIGAFRSSLFFWKGDSSTLNIDFVVIHYSSEHWKSTAHFRKPVKHHDSAPHKHHPFHHNSSANEPGVLKNIILHKTLPQQISPQNAQVRASLVSTSVNKSTNQDGLATATDSLKEKGTVQATGRAILVHNANNGAAHVVQGKNRT